MKTNTLTLRGRALCAALALVLACGLVPSQAFSTIAHAEPSDASSEAAATGSASDAAVDRISEDVALGPVAGSAAEGSSDGADAGDPVEGSEPAAASDAPEQPVVAGGSAPAVGAEDILHVQVNVADAGIADTVIAFGGLTYIVNDDGEDTVTLTGWTGTAPKGALTVPAQITSGATTYKVSRIAIEGRGSAHSALSGAEEPVDPADADPYAADLVDDGAKAAAVTSIAIPATVQAIDPAFFQMFPGAASVHVAAGNPTYQSHNGMLLDAASSSLLLIPEGMEGAAVLPSTLATVPACVFTRCTKLTAIVFPEGSSGSESFTSANGILYSADKATLIAAPAGLGTSATIAPECTTIAEGAFWGNTALETIVAQGHVEAIGTPSVGARFIAPAKGEDADTGAGEDADDIAVPAFSPEVAASATVALTAEGAKRAPWEAAGFRNFSEPAEPGETIEPAEGSGFAFDLLADYTLAVRWQGDDPAPAALTIPAYGILNGVQYTVSAIANDAFAGQASIITVDMPDTITRIGEGAFDGCTGLKTVHLAGATKTIGSRAFAGTALQSLVLPAGVAVIADEALAGLDGTTIVALDHIGSIAPQALAGSAGISVYAPAKAGSADGWNAGLPATGNHVYAYGVQLSGQPMVLEQGQTVDLFADGSLQAPGAVQVSYAYKANPLSISDEGLVTAKMPGSSNVGVTLTLTVEETVVNTPKREVVQLEPAAYTPGEKTAAIDAPQTVQRTMALASAAVPVSTVSARASEPAAQADTYIRNLKAYSDTAIYRQTSPDGTSYGTIEMQAAKGYIPYLQVEKISFKSGSVILEGLYAPPTASSTSGSKQYYKLGIDKTCTGVTDVWYRTGDGVVQSVKSGTTATVAGKTDILLYLDYTATGAAVSLVRNVKAFAGGGTLYRSIDSGNGFGAKAEPQTATTASAYTPYIKVMKIGYSSGSVVLEGYYHPTTASSETGERRVYKMGLNESGTGVTKLWYRDGSNPWQSIKSGAVVDTAGKTDLSLYLDWTAADVGVSSTERNANFRSGSGAVYRGIDAGYGSRTPESTAQTATEKSPYTPHEQITRLIFTGGSVFAEGFYAPPAGVTTVPDDVGKMRTYMIGTNTSATGVTSVYYTISNGPLLRLGSGASVDLTNKKDVKVYLNWNAEAVGVTPKKNLYGYARDGRLFRVTDANDGHALSRGEWQTASRESAYFPNLCVTRIAFSGGSVYISGFYAESKNETGELRVWKLGLNESCAGVTRVWYSVDDGLPQGVKSGATVDVPAEANIKLYLDWTATEAGAALEKNLKAYAGGGKLYRVTDSGGGFAAQATETQTATKDRPYVPYLNVSRLFFDSGSVFLEGYYTDVDDADKGKLKLYKLGMDSSCSGVHRLLYSIEGADLQSVALGGVLEVGGRPIEIYLDWSQEDAGVAAERNTIVYGGGGSLWRTINVGSGWGYGSLEQQNAAGYVPFLQVVSMSLTSGSLFLKGYLVNDENEGNGQLRSYKVGINETCDGVTDAWYRFDDGMMQPMKSGVQVSVSGQKAKVYLNWKNTDEGTSLDRNITAYASGGKLYRKYTDGGDWTSVDAENLAVASNPYRPYLHATVVMLDAGGHVSFEGFNSTNGTARAYQAGVKNGTFDGVTSVKYRLGASGALQTLRPGVKLDVASQADVRLYLNFAADALTVNLEANGGQLAAGTASPQSVGLGLAPTISGNPTREGFTFAGWATDVAGTARYDATLPVLADLTLYAQWIQGDYYEVRFYGFTDDAAGDTAGGKALQVFRGNQSATADYAGLSLESKVTMPRQYAAAGNLPATPYVTETVFGHHMSDWSGSPTAITTSTTLLAGSTYVVSDLVPYVADKAAAGTADDPFIINLYAGWVLDISLNMPTDDAIDVKMDGLANAGQAETELAIVSNTPAAMKVGAASALQDGTPAYDVLLNGSEDRASAADIDDSVQFTFSSKRFPANGSTGVELTSGWDIAAATETASGRLADKLALALGDTIHMDWDSITHAGPKRWENLSTITWKADLADPTLRAKAQLLTRA